MGAFERLTNTLLRECRLVLRVLLRVLLRVRMRVRMRVLTRSAPSLLAVCRGPRRPK